MPTARRSTTLAGLALAALLAGCVVVPAEPYRGPVMVAPPPPQAEVIGVAPVPGYIWIGGYWNWVGNRHVWVRGHWAAPRHGYVWRPHEWRRDGPGWRPDPGRWERR